MVDAHERTVTRESGGANVDLITREVIKNGLTSLANEMAVVVVRTAYVTVSISQQPSSTRMGL